MSRTFLPTRRDRPCPVCGDTSGDCRSADELLLCMKQPDGGVPGFLYLGLDRKQGLWGLYRPAAGADPRPRRLPARRQPTAATLSAAARDRAYRKIHHALGVSESHRRKLERERGLTRTQIDWAIAQGWLTSWQRGADVGTVPEDLAGVEPTTGHLVGSTGLAIAALDSDGHIVGYQIAPDRGRAKYVWLSSASRGGSGPQLPSGHLPLFVRQHPERDPTQPSDVWLVEGGLKSLLVALRQWESGERQTVVIGAAGGNFAGLDEALSRLDARSLQVFPDAGDVQNPQVMRRWRGQLPAIAARGLPVTVGWWGQVEKPGPDQSAIAGDIDEIADWSQVEHLSPADFLRQDRTRVALDIRRLLRKLAGQRSRPSGFGPSSPAPARPEPTRYAAGDRLATWQQSGRVVLDSSGVGLGKSHDAGTVTGELFGGDRVFYLTSDPRNVTTSTLTSWQVLGGRHGGLRRDEHGKLRRRKPGEPKAGRLDAAELRANCARTETIAALQAAGIEGASTAETICTTCPYLEACRSGNVYGFLGERRQALQRDRIVTHPSALPNSEDFDYSTATIVVDEASRTLPATRAIAAKQRDIDATIAALATAAPEQFAPVQPLLAKIRDIATGKIPAPNARYGWGGVELLAALRELLPDNLDPDAIAAALDPDLGFLDLTGEYGVSLADLGPSARRALSDRDSETAERAGDILRQWFVPLLRVLRGDRGWASCAYGTLTVTTPDQRIADILARAGKVILLDATATPSELAAIAGIPVERIEHVAQREPAGADLQLVQIDDLGLLGQQRGNEQQRRADAVVAHLKQPREHVAVMELTRHARAGDRRWFVDSRGSNDLQEAKCLVLVGTPCPHLESLRAEFACLFGREPSGAEFDRFARERVTSEVRQAIGRLRASRRAEEHLEVFLLTNADLELSAERCCASDLTPEAGTQREQWEAAIARRRRVESNGRKANPVRDRGISRGEPSGVVALPRIL